MGFLVLLTFLFFSQIVEYEMDLNLMVEKTEETSPDRLVSGNTDFPVDELK